MNFLKILRNPVFWVLLLVGLLASRDLLRPGYFPMHDDLQMMRQLEMEKCFKDFQMPCRWVPDMGYGFGFPLFNYYPPLPYLIGEGMRALGFAFTATVKTTFLLSFVLSGFTMYLLGREFWGRMGGLVSAVFYVWAPYHAVDVYVRGAMNENWALVWFPLILLASYKLILSPALKWVVVLALSWAALLLSHNVMILIFTPVFALWCLLWLWRARAWRKIPQLIISGIWAAGLAAFFSIPVLLEQRLVQVETLVQGYYEYIAHFVNINQLFFSRFWGYGPSVWGENDGMPFPIGHLHWILSLVVGLLLLAKLLKKEKISHNLLFVICYLLFVGWAASFMTHSRSTPIWQAVPFLSITQFPWRFLTIVILAFSFLAGAIVPLLGDKKQLTKTIVVTLVVGVIVWNFNFFRVERMGPVTDEEKLSGEAWRLQQTAGIYDYLPKTAKIAPQAPRKEPVEIVEGQVTINETKQGTDWLTTQIDVSSTEAIVRVNILYFPDWKVFINGKEEKIELLDDNLGRIHVVVPQGTHSLDARLFNTAPRTASNLISFISWLTLLTLPIWRRRIK